jgi:hypothetical protein
LPLPSAAVTAALAGSATVSVICGGAASLGPVYLS